MNSNPDPKASNVVDFFTGKTLHELSLEKIIRICPENDGLCMLYSNDNMPNRFFSMNIPCWGLRKNGEVVGMVPWLAELIPCTEITDPLHGCWQGYYDAEKDLIFYDPPMHKVIELETAVAYFDHDDAEKGYKIVQAVPDNIGTHAMLLGEQPASVLLKEVVGWRLDNQGHLSGMLVDPAKVENTPVLLGDKSVYAAEENPRFRYFFQHHIANQIKKQDPEAIRAITMLLQH